MVTWLQYFGPDMSAHIGVNRLRSAPFYSVEFYPNGAHLARTAEAHGDVWPWHERRPLLDHLGLAQRKPGGHGDGNRQGGGEQRTVHGGPSPSALW